MESTPPPELSGGFKFWGPNLWRTLAATVLSQIGNSFAIRRAGQECGGQLEAIRGHVPMPLELPPGCAFASRCPQVMDRCAGDLPELAAAGATGHRAACWLPEVHEA